ncbi:MAG TPA: hypothetical protein VL989_02460 [Candidatus Sulfotelmatobacter sp.]|nr:hypothetical protein [Candidatus Sulfotelmatobacter sp.]
MLQGHETARKWTIGVGVLYVSIFGAWAGTRTLDRDSEAQVNAQKTYLAQGQERLADDKSKLSDLEKELGKKCTALVRAYGPGGLLDRESFDASVNNIVSNPAEPCADNPIVVASELRSYADDSRAIRRDLSHTVKEQKDLATAQLSHDRTVGNIVGDSALDAALVEAGLFMAAGMAFAIIASN